MNDIFRAIREFGIVPVVKIEGVESALLLANALKAGGLPCAEITFRTAAAKEVISCITRNMPDMLVGAGTVINIKQAEEALEAGAHFIVSPGYSASMVDWCQTRGIPVIPGVATPTEIIMALDKGLNILKLFPAEVIGGLHLIKALSAVYDEVRFIPTGGIVAENLLDYLRAPAVLACGGSWLVSNQLIFAGKFDEIQRLTEEAVCIVRHARGREL